jgi:hypothetical protein
MVTLNRTNLVIVARLFCGQGEPLPMMIGGQFLPEQLILSFFLTGPNSLQGHRVLLLEAGNRQHERPSTTFNTTILLIRQTTLPRQLSNRRAVSLLSHSWSLSHSLSFVGDHHNNRNLRLLCRLIVFRMQIQFWIAQLNYSSPQLIPCN